MFKITLSLALLVTFVATAQDTQKDEKEVKISFITEKQRLEALRNAEMIDTQDTKIGQANILKGPDQKSKKKNEFLFGDHVYCRFTTPAAEMGGRTPKFKCIVEKIERVQMGKLGLETTSIPVKPKDEIKVKFKPEGKENKEIHAEATATRLFWSLGYFADAVYPVTLTCLGCPENPLKEVDDVFNPVREQEHNYGIATIERKYPGEKLEEKVGQGWTWKELSLNKKNSIAVKDGLLLLAAFVGHGDAKPPQQRLVCPKGKIEPDAEFEYAGCKKPKMFVQDLGATFGGGGNLTTSSAKMDLEHWIPEDKEVWKSDSECKARLDTSLTANGAVQNPVISENGRRYLAARLCQLSDQQIVDLFSVARVDQLGDGSNFTSKNVNEWVAAFKLKRKMIVDRQDCKWSGTTEEHKPFDQARCDFLLKKAHPELK